MASLYVFINLWINSSMPNDGGATWTSYGKAFGSSNSWRTKLWSFIALCQSRSKECKERITERGKTEWRKQRKTSCSLLLHFWSTSRSPFSTFYIPLQRSGSQESSASNGARFGVETKKLQPLQVNHSKVLRNHPFVARISQPFCTMLWISSWSFTPRWKPNTTRWKPT